MNTLNATLIMGIIVGSIVIFISNSIGIILSYFEIMSMLFLSHLFVGMNFLLGRRK